VLAKQGKDSQYPFNCYRFSIRFEAANTLLELAKEQAKVESETRDEVELMKLKESYGTTGSRLATGGSKAVKELEKDQAMRTKRINKDLIDTSLLEIQQHYQKLFYKQESDHTKSEKTIYLIGVIEKSRRRLQGNASTQLTLESMFTELR
jgi:DNA polymerase III subunit delta'